jgi:hypothetical protein
LENIFTEKKIHENFAPTNAEMSSREVYGSVSEKNQREQNGVEKIQGGGGNHPSPGNPRVGLMGGKRIVTEYFKTERLL